MFVTKPSCEFGVRSEINRVSVSGLVNGDCLTRMKKVPLEVISRIAMSQFMNERNRHDFSVDFTAILNAAASDNGFNQST
uniref:Uncharacterized protein n=1 Tax=Heterorhabditis bacteriophora TaxID=37862 RepID=A0A1I7WWV4_HETBA